MFSNDEPISFKMKQDLLPKIQGKTLLVLNFGAINEVMDALKDAYDIPLKRTLRQQRIMSFNNWARLTNTTVATPFGDFEKDIMKGRISIPGHVPTNNQTNPS